MYLLTWRISQSLWHEVSAAACSTISPGLLVLGEIKSGKWRKWAILKQLWQQSAVSHKLEGYSRHCLPEWGIRPRQMRSNTPDKCVTSLIPASPHSCTATCSQHLCSCASAGHPSCSFKSQLRMTLVAMRGREVKTFQNHSHASLYND